MIITRQFVNTGKDRPLRTKKAVEAMHEAARVTFSCDTIITSAYIGNGVYTVITGKKGF